MAQNRAVRLENNNTPRVTFPASGPNLLPKVLIWLLVERFETGSEVTRLDRFAWRFATAPFASRPLQAAIEASPGIDPAVALASHLAAGRIIGFELGARDPSARSAEHST